MHLKGSTPKELRQVTSVAKQLDPTTHSSGVENDG